MSTTQNTTLSLFYQAKAVCPFFTAQLLTDMINEEDRKEKFKKEYTRQMVYNATRGRSDSDEVIDNMLKRIISGEVNPEEFLSLEKK